MACMCFSFCYGRRPAPRRRRRSNRMTSSCAITIISRFNTTVTDKRQLESDIELRSRGSNAVPSHRLRYRHYEGWSGEKRLHRRSKTFCLALCRTNNTLLTRQALHRAY